MQISGGKHNCGGLQSTPEDTNEMPSAISVGQMDSNMKLHSSCAFAASPSGNADAAYYSVAVDGHQQPMLYQAGRA